MTKLHRATIDVKKITQLLDHGLISEEQAGYMVIDEEGSVGPATVCGVAFLNGTVTWTDSDVTCEDCNEIMILNTLGALP
jgi:hypothetical protein